MPPATAATAGVGVGSRPSLPTYPSGSPLAPPVAGLAEPRGAQLGHERAHVRPASGPQQLGEPEPCGTLPGPRQRLDRRRRGRRRLGTVLGAPVAGDMRARAVEERHAVALPGDREAAVL